MRPPVRQNGNAVLGAGARNGAEKPGTAQRWANLSTGLLRSLLGIWPCDGFLFTRTFL